ncbi:MAG: uroporphyrinogen decarboxylase family protein, partial [Thermoleophilia bacterium]|nr:uroporphyrinogen decarboxylase family protein [Thermoleophilia bacterium]
RANDECFLEGDCLADALAASRERFGYDGVLAEMGLGPEPGVLGCPMEVEGNDVPLVVETIVGGRDDFGSLKIPADSAAVAAGGKLQPVERLIGTSGGEFAVLGSVRSPFEYAATVRGLMEFMTDFYRDPELVRDLISAVTPATLAVGRALAETGIDALVMKDSFASSSMISPDHYREFAWPAERDAIAELSAEIPVILHICRNSMPIIEDMAATGAAVLEIDSPVDLAAARKAVGDKVILKGNIDAAAVIEKGSLEDVKAAVQVAMEAAKAGGRFILSSGDSISLAAPEENLAALVRYGREYGRY